MQNLNFQCAKCGGAEYEVGARRAIGEALSTSFGVQNNHFTSDPCTRCKDPEFEQAKRSTPGNIFDLLRI